MVRLLIFTSLPVIVFMLGFYIFVPESGNWDDLSWWVFLVLLWACGIFVFGVVGQMIDDITR
jgi:hypothetical protein